MQAVFSRRAMRRCIVVFALALIGTAWAEFSAKAADELTNEQLAKEIQNLANRLGPQTRNDSKVQDALKSLAIVLRDDCKLYYVGAATDCYLTSISNTVDSLNLNLGATKLKRSQTSGVAVNDVINRLKALLEPPAPPPIEHVINIIQAYYGDMRTASLRVDRDYDSKLSVAPYLQRGDTDRICSATRAVQAYCQGKPSCFIGDTAPKTGVNLCGYEPAPYADLIDKGLAIQYQCIPQVDYTVDPAELDTDPETKIGKVRVMQLRLNETARIICSEDSK